MTITTRKERERREREARILQLAQGMLRESGYLGLSMDRIAAGMDYSKGTIYQHFPNKEEIVLALANEALETRVRLFEKGAGWSGTTRERISAIGVAAAHFVRLYPQHFAVEQLVRSGAIWEKTTEQRRNFMLHCETSCMRVVGGVVHEAVVAGDLRLREGITPADVVFGLWSMNFGAYIIITGTDTLGETGLPDPERTLWSNLNTLLDGYQWRALSTEVDYDAKALEIAETLFAPEAVL
jgi:AcrR family transcriptional regulator